MEGLRDLLSYALSCASRYIFENSQTVVPVEADVLFVIFFCQGIWGKSPTSSHISAPSYLPMVTSNMAWLFFLAHVVCLSNRRDSRACIMIRVSWSVMVVSRFAKSIAFIKSSSVIVKKTTVGYYSGAQNNNSRRLDFLTNESTVFSLFLIIT